MKKLAKKIVKKFLKKTCQLFPSKVQRLATFALAHSYNSPPPTWSNAGPQKDALLIGVYLHGGLGDCLVSLTWLKELVRSLKCPCAIDLYAPLNFLDAITGDLPFVRNCLPHSFYNLPGAYDLELQISHIIEIDHLYPERIKARDAELFSLLVKIKAFHSKYQRYVSNMPYLDGIWADYCVLRGWNRFSELGLDGLLPFDNNLRLGLNLRAEALNVLKDFGLSRQQYICIHAGSDQNNPNPEKNPKIWLIAHCNEFCAIFKERHPEIKIVQLGSVADRAIDGADLNLQGKISLEQAFVLIKEAATLVDNEGGLVHAAHQLAKKAVVLFGPTPAAYFAYPENINLEAKVCGNCLWKTEDWSTCCPQGFDTPACMQSIEPAAVMEAVESLLMARPHYQYRLGQSALYNSGELKKNGPKLAQIMARLGLVKEGGSDHAFGPCGIHIHSSKQWEYPFALEHIERLAKKLGKSQLKIGDIGGGRGALAPWLAQLGHSVTVFDIGYSWASQSSDQDFFRYGRENAFKVDYGSIYNIPADDASFDVVTCISVVEHLPQKIPALRELLRVLAPGGCLILTYDLINDAACTDNYDRRIGIFTPDSLVECLSAMGIEGIVAYDPRLVLQSLDEIQADGIEIPKGITVGGLVISKDYKA